MQLLSRQQALSSSAASQRAPVARPAPVVCRASSSKGEQQGSIQLGLCSAAAGLLLSVMPAQAGVVLAEPALKKFDEPVPQEQKQAAPKPEKKEEKKAEEPMGEDPVDPRALALPAALIAIGGAGFAYSRVDPEFSDWLNDSGALVRNSREYAGFEEDITETYPYVADGVFPSKGGGGGAKKAAAPKKGGGFPFGKK